MKVIGFVFKHGEYFIGLDNDSGGYPYKTEYFTSSKIWQNEYAAKEYQKLVDKLEEWKLFPVYID